MTYCASSFVGRQSQSRNCYHYEIIIKTRVHKRGSTRTFKGSREHFHDNIYTVTFCNANNMAFMSNPRPSSIPMFVKFRKRTAHTKMHSMEFYSSSGVILFLVDFI